MLNILRLRLVSTHVLKSVKNVPANLFFTVYLRSLYLQGKLKQYLEKNTSNTSLERLGKYKTLKMNNGSCLQSTIFQTNQTYDTNQCINQDGYLAMTPAATLPATLGLNRICQRLGIDVISISKSNISPFNASKLKGDLKFLISRFLRKCRSI